MGFFRTISVSFWTDPKVDDDFTPEDKYFYLYLMTNPHTNLAGCYELSDKQAERETGYNQDTIKRLLNRLEFDHKVIMYNKENKEVLLLNWGKYNWSSSDKVRKAVLSVSDHIKTGYFRAFIEQAVSSKLKEKERTKEKETVIETVTVTEIEKDTDTDIDVSLGYTYPNDTVSEEKPVRHKYGALKNVLLLDDEYKKLMESFPDEYQKMIDNLSYYIGSHGNKYKSHYLTILNWKRKDEEKDAAGPVKKESPWWAQ